MRPGNEKIIKQNTSLAVICIISPAYIVCRGCFYVQAESIAGVQLPGFWLGAIDRLLHRICVLVLRPWGRRNGFWICAVAEEMRHKLVLLPIESNSNEE